MDGRDPRAAKPPRHLLILVVVVIALVLLGTALLLNHDGSQAAEMEAYRRGWCVIASSLPRRQMLIHIAVGAPALVWLVSLPWMMFAAKRTLRKRIGADGHHLLYDPGDGIVQRYAWSTVMIDRRGQLLLGAKVISLAGPQALTFPLDTLKGFVLSRIPDTNRIHNTQLIWLSIRRGNLTNRMLLAGVTAVLLIELISFWRPQVLQALLALLR